MLTHLKYISIGFIGFATLIFMGATCTGTNSFDSSSPIVQRILSLCQDVEIQQYDDCLKAESEKQGDLGTMTVGDLQRLLGIAPPVSDPEPDVEPVPSALSVPDPE